MNRRTSIATITGGAAAFFSAMGSQLRAAEEAAGGKGKFKHSVCKWCFGKIPLDELCSEAKKIGIESVEILGPDQWGEVAKWMADDLRTCAEYGREHGVLIGVQNHGDMLKTAKQTIQIVKTVDSDWFGVIVDTGYFMTRDPYIDIGEVIPYAVNWQVKESPFGKTSPIRTDLNRLIPIIKDAGYRGYLPIETLAVEGRPYDPHTLVPAFLNELREAIRRAS